MIIIIDVNIILSALIKDSVTRELIIKAEQDFCFPEPSLNKIRKYKSLILDKSGLSEEDFSTILGTLFRFIRIISTEELLSNWGEAKAAMEKIDPEDVPFIAAALSQENAVIWSEDKHFEQQDKIAVVKTLDMVKLFYQ